MSSESRRRFPIQLGRRDSSEPSTSEVGKATYLLSPVPSRRTSSLPNGSPGRDVIISSLSSPSKADEVTLLPPGTVSRTSSTSSRRHSRSSTSGETYAALTAAPLGSPLIVNDGRVDDLGPPVGMDNEDATIRGKRRYPDPTSLSPRSVHSESPSPDRNALLQATSLPPLSVKTGAAVQSTFVAASPSSTSRSSRPDAVTPIKEAEDPLEYVSTPVTPSNQGIGENDEQKGKRLASEFLEDDFFHVSIDKVATFLGGP